MYIIGNRLGWLGWMGWLCKYNYRELGTYIHKADYVGKHYVAKWLNKYVY